MDAQATQTTGSTGEAGRARRRPSPLSLLDPGWPFLITGILLVSATVLVPAADELAEVRFQRDRALALERHRLARLQQHEQYLAALEREEPALVVALAATQLNQVPQGRQLVLEGPDTFNDPAGAISASVFAGLEPAPLVLPERQPPGSLLHRLTTDDATRPWVMGAGMMCLLLGLLPRSR